MQGEKRGGGDRKMEKRQERKEDHRRGTEIKDM